jgi:penicillin-binding protein 1A
MKYLGYLNTTYFGEGAYGVQAASKIYFNKDVEYLNLAECATLAGIIQAPNYLSPYFNEKDSIARRNVVLAKMLELNFIDEEQFTDTIKQPIITQRPFQETPKGFALYFVEYVKQILIEKYGVNKVFTGGFKSTQHLTDMQVAAECNKTILFDLRPSAALVAMGPRQFIESYGQARILEKRNSILQHRQKAGRLYILKFCFLPLLNRV